MPVRNGVGHSGATPDKEEGLKAYLWLHTHIVYNVFHNPKNYWLKYREYLYIDTNCGSGNNPEEDVDGSPVIAINVLRRSGMRFQAHFIDCECGNIKVLQTIIPVSPDVHFYIADNRDVLPVILQSVPKTAYGMIYMDPNGIPDFELLADACRNHKYLDLMIRCNSSAIKKNLHNGARRLPEMMSVIPKSRWLVRDVLPSDKWQFTFLFATNYSQYGDWKKNRFYLTTDPEGKRILDKLTFTSAEIDELNQPHLFAEQDASTRSGGICERCKKRPATEPHHTSYYPEKMIMVCHECHCELEGKDD